MCVGPAKPAEHLVWPWIFFCFFSLFQDKEKKGNKCCYIFILCTFFCLCKRKCQRKAHRQRYTAVAGTPWFSFGATVNWAKQFLSSTYPNLKDERACFVIHWKPKRRCVPFLPSLNLKYLFRGNGTRRLINNSSAANRSLKNVLAPSFSSYIIN